MRKTPKLQKKFVHHGSGGNRKIHKKNYCILFNVITFTFRSRYHIRAHFNSVILQPWRSHHQRLAFELEVKWQKFQKNLCRMQLSPTVATSASTRAQELLISRRTCGNIREKSLSSAINVATLAQKLATSRHTLKTQDTQAHSHWRTTRHLQSMQLLKQNI